MNKIPLTYARDELIEGVAGLLLFSCIVGFFLLFFWAAVNFESLIEKFQYLILNGIG